VLDWPANSPDLNPIENAWAIVTQALKKKKITSFEQYKKALIKEWDSLSHKHIRNLITSMDTRL